MGILHKLVFILGKLDPHNKLWKDRQLANAVKIEDPVAREKWITDIEYSFERNEMDYGRKLYLIQNCIYGVDIQPIAVQIAKLRFFISLVVDQKRDEKRENRGISPLPNLETKFVAANTLIGLDKPKLGQKLILRNPLVVQKEKELGAVRQRYFTARTQKTKQKCKDDDSRLRTELSGLLVRDGFTGETALKVANWDPYDQNTHAEWFDPEWMFGVISGFDIVIANPPYIQLQKDNGKLANLYTKSGYKTFNRMGDIYALFYENGVKNLRNNGYLCFITSNKWMRAGYGESLRSYLLAQNPIMLVDLGLGVFENAVVDTAILVIENSPNSNSLMGLTLSADAKDIDLGEYIKRKAVPLRNMNKEIWFIGNDAELKLKEKFGKIGKPLKDWDVNIYRGIVTGLNEAFFIDSQTKERLCEEDPKSAQIIKPILRGKDIKRYGHEWAEIWIIFVPWHFPLHEDLSIQGASQKAEIEFKKQYPAVYKHLLQFKDSLSNRNITETNITYEWYALQRCAATYYPEFEKKKIIYPNMTKYLPFIYDAEGFITNQKCFIITSETESLKYLTGYLNSTTAHKWIRENCPELQGGTRELSKIFFENIPIPPVTPQNQLPVKNIESLVEEILTKKKQHLTTTVLESQIDQLVYQLYELTPEEITVMAKNK